MDLKSASSANIKRILRRSLVLIDKALAVFLEGWTDSMQVRGHVTDASGSRDLSFGRNINLQLVTTKVPLHEPSTSNWESRVMSAT